LLEVNMSIWQEDPYLPRSRALRGGGEAGDFPPGVECVRFTNPFIREEAAHG
jgi:hypothetical protein